MATGEAPLPPALGFVTFRFEQTKRRSAPSLPLPLLRHPPNSRPLLLARNALSLSSSARKSSRQSRNASNCCEARVIFPWFPLKNLVIRTSPMTSRTLKGGRRGGREGGRRELHTWSTREGLVPGYSSVEEEGARYPLRSPSHHSGTLSILNPPPFLKHAPTVLVMERRLERRQRKRMHTGTESTTLPYHPPHALSSRSFRAGKTTPPRPRSLTTPRPHRAWRYTLLFSLCNSASSPPALPAQPGSPAALRGWPY